MIPYPKLFLYPWLMNLSHRPLVTLLHPLPLAPLLDHWALLLARSAPSWPMPSDACDPTFLPCHWTYTYLVSNDRARGHYCLPSHLWLTRTFPSIPNHNLPSTPNASAPLPTPNNTPPEPFTAGTAGHDSDPLAALSRLPSITDHTLFDQFTTVGTTPANPDLDIHPPGKFTIQIGLHTNITLLPHLHFKRLGCCPAARGCLVNLSSAGRRSIAVWHDGG